jgi:hypothetical protein
VGDDKGVKTVRFKAAEKARIHSTSFKSKLFKELDETEIQNTSGILGAVRVEFAFLDLAVKIRAAWRRVKENASFSVGLEESLRHVTLSDGMRMFYTTLMRSQRRHGP